jgi:8-oxo-dGTP pyrophosphatase MutT (NUDIX family)
MVRQMYHIFHGKHRLILANPQDEMKIDKPDFVISNSEEDPIKKVLTLASENSRKTTIVLLGNPKELLKKVQDVFHLITAAGGLVLNPKNELLFIKRLGKWDLPKGKLEPGEDIETCAIREVMEETGAKNLTLSHALPDTFHTYYQNKQWIIKQTHWYRMNANQEQSFVPQIEEGIEEVKWMTISDINLNELDTYPAIQYIIDAYLNAMN